MNLAQDPVINRLISLMNVVPSDRILEIGCGEGALCRALAPFATEGVIVGLDCSNDAIRAARSLSIDQDNILYVWGEAEQVPWQDNYFSHSLLVDTIHELAVPEKVLPELLRVLSPEGTLWIVHTANQSTHPVPASGRTRTNPVEWMELLRESGFAGLHYGVPATDPTSEEIEMAPWDNTGGGLSAFVEGMLNSARKPSE